MFKSRQHSIAPKVPGFLIVGIFQGITNFLFKQFIEIFVYHHWQFVACVREPVLLRY